jgi:threonine/homoserine/homoserine lactone efflux protein
MPTRDPAAGLGRAAVLSFLVLGPGIGFVAGVSPGPALTLLVAETFRGGWPRGAAVAADR